MEYVPEGSVLGPLLCIDDTDDVVVNKALKFADDTKLIIGIAANQLQDIERLQKKI